MNWSAETLKKVVIFRSMHRCSLKLLRKETGFPLCRWPLSLLEFLSVIWTAESRKSFIDWCYRFHISMLFNTSLLLSSPNTTTTSPTPILNELTPVAVDEQIFFQTAAARGISGIFVWLSLIITCHQVRNS